jgi:serine/threonine-protein kinase 24/25/MST4
MAPEVIRRSAYDFKADIWSLGITVYEMATGNPPFANQDPLKAIFLIPRNPPAVLDGDFKLELKEFVSLCLNDDPTAVRLSAVYSTPIHAHNHKL